MVNILPKRKLDLNEVNEEMMAKITRFNQLKTGLNLKITLLLIKSTS